MVENEVFNSILSDAITAFHAGNSFSKSLIENYDNDDFFNYVLERSEYLLKFPVSYLINQQNARDTILYAISFIAIRKYGDGGNKEIWPYIRAFLPSFYQIHSNMIGDNTVRKILNSYDLLPDMPNSSIGPAIALCGITQKWLKNFFDFSFDIYKHNLFRQDNDRETVVQEFEDVFDAMRHGGFLMNADDSFETNEKTFEVDGQIVTVKGKKYKLSQFTQSAIRNFSSTLFLSEIGATCVELITRYDNLEAIEKVPAYFQSAYQKWKEDYDKKGERNAKRSGERHTSPHLALATVNGQLTPVILPPQRKVSDKYAPNRLRIRITNSKGEPIASEITPTVIDAEVIGGYMIGADPIPLRDVFGGIHYELVSDDGILPLPQRDWDHEFFFFDQNPSSIYKNASIHREIKPGNDFEGEIIILSKPEPTDGIKPWKQFPNYWLSTKTISPADTYKIGKGFYSFCKSIEPGLQGDRNRFVDAEVFGINGALPVFKSLESIVLDAPSISVSEFSLVIDGEEWEPERKVLRRLDGGNQTIKMMIPCLDVGLHQICVMHHSETISCFWLFIEPVLSVNYRRLGDFRFAHIQTSYGEFEEKFMPGEASVSVNLFEETGKRILLEVKTTLPFYSLDGKTWFDPGQRLLFTRLKDNECKLRVVGFIDPVLRIGENVLPPSSFKNGEAVFSYT